MRNLLYLIRIAEKKYMEFYLLEQLMAVYTEGSLNAAAKALHLTQPTLTRSMQKLERELGVPLFQRTPNQVRLNENGLTAVNYARRILQDEKEMKENIGKNQRLTVGCNAPGPGMIVRKEFPGATVLPVQTTRVLLEELRKGKIDLLITSEVLEDLDLFRAEMCEEHLYISVPEKHPLTKYFSLTYAQVDGMSFVMVDEIGIWKEVVKRQMPHSTFLLQDSVDALSEIVLASTIPSFATNITLQYLHATETSRRYIPFTGKESSLSFSMYCLRDRKNLYTHLFEQCKK